MKRTDLTMKERLAAFEKEINGEMLQHEMVRKANNYRKDYTAYIKDAKVTDALTVGKDTEGGYLVPDEMEEKIGEALKENNVMRKVANVITTKKALNLVCAGNKPQGIWVDEGAPITFSDMDFYKVVIDAHKNGCIVRVTDELVEDAGFNIEKYIIKCVGEKIGALEEEAFLLGDGNNKPRGVLLDAPVGAEAKQITGDDLMNLLNSLGGAYYKNAVWIMSDAAEEAIRRLKAYNGKPLWQPDLTKNAPGMLFGKPVYVASEMPGILPGNCPIAFGDFSYYWIGDRGNRAIKRLNELYADKGMVGYRITHRVDGKLIVPEAVKTLKIVA